VDTPNILSSAKDGDEIVILLCAGFKDRQNNDLDAAEKYRADYLRSKKHGRA
jgi:putative component of toxin-antitoxin plasmid stabilization module